jgi:NitT/TauT family transport system substrate-binding protein
MSSALLSLASPLRRWRILVLLLAAVGGVGLAWLLVQRQPRKVTVAITTWPGYEYFYLAEQKQLALAEGLDLRVNQYTSLEDQRLAFVRGDVNVMATTLPEAIAVCQDVPSRCPQLILVLDQSLGGDRVMARTDVASSRDLVGRRVGLERTVLAEYLLLRSLAGAPVAIEQFQLRFDGPVALVQQLKAGELDAIVTYSPHDIPLEQDDRFHELFSSRDIPGEVVDVLAVDPVFAQARARDLRDLVRTWWAVRDYARRNRTEAVAVMAQRQQISPADFSTSELGLQYPSAAEQLQLLAADGPVAETIERMAALMRQERRIRADSPLPQPSTAFLLDP